MNHKAAPHIPWVGAGFVTACVCWPAGLAALLCCISANSKYGSGDEEGSFGTAATANLLVYAGLIIGLALYLVAYQTEYARLTSATALF